MPLLAAEPALYPAELFTPAQSPEPESRDWWVLHTRPRQEKSLARQLHEHRIPFYLPLITRRYRLRNRLVQSHMPLFDGYLFLLAGKEERTKALTTNRIVRTLQVEDQEKLWRDLRQINQLIASGAPITPENRLVPGALTEIRSGPLAGLKGKIIRAMSGGKFVVEVDFIQRGASILLEDVDLMRIEPDVANP